jgi:hypothetical protein
MGSLLSVRLEVRDYFGVTNKMKKVQQNRAATIKMDCLINRDSMVPPHVENKPNPPTPPLLKGGEGRFFPPKAGFEGASAVVMDNIDLTSIAFFPKIRYETCDFSIQIPRFEWKFQEERVEKDGLGLNSDCVGGADPSGPDGDGIWIEGRMALARDCSRDREPFPKPQECGRLDDDAYWYFNPWLAVLFDSSFDSGLCEGLFSPCPSDCGWDPLAFEISKRVMG